MEKENRKNLTRVLVALLIVLFIILMYIYFIVLESGGGIVSNSKKKVGKIEFLFGIYGPGRGEFPEFNMPMSVATDKDNNIYVTDAGHNRVCVFNSQGEFEFEFGEKGVAHPIPGDKANWKPGTFSFPYGIAIDDETGNIFVGDMVNERIQVFDSGGKFLDWFPKGPYGGTASNIFPTDIAVKNGKVYVCSAYQVVIFTTGGKYVTDFGMPGNGVGQLDRPNGIDVGDDGTIYVADSNNIRLQAFTERGKVKWVVGKPTAVGAGIEPEKDRVFGLPRNIAVGPDGNIYVADAFHFQIKVFSPQGKQLAAMGKRGIGDGEFNFNNGIVLTRDSIIYIVDKQPGRVQAIRFTGFWTEDPIEDSSEEN